MRGLLFYTPHSFIEKKIILRNESGFDFLKKKREIFPEAIIASDWWASKLLEPTIKYYNGNMCLSIQKESIPSKESVALFKSNLTQVINNMTKLSIRKFIALEH